MVRSGVFPTLRVEWIGFKLLGHKTSLLAPMDNFDSFSRKQSTILIRWIKRGKKRKLASAKASVKKCEDTILCAYAKRSRRGSPSFIEMT